MTAFELGSRIQPHIITKDDVTRSKVVRIMWTTTEIIYRR